jgi:hypothetical protein
MTDVKGFLQSLETDLTQVLTNCNIAFAYKGSDTASTLAEVPDLITALESEIPGSFANVYFPTDISGGE